ncbi:hypothetical protein HAT91_01960 [Dickeya solani]|nr:hypothetical protein HAT91_01960 [Dickeya solani]
MPRHHASRGILVLESPWELDEHDANRSSVVPFIEGIAKVAGDTEVYYANFYDKKSFRTALHCLCKIPFKNIIIYVAAHGQGKELGGTHIRDVLVPVGELSHHFNITGLLLGACFVGAHTDLMETFTSGNYLRWCAGYASETEWLTGTLIDCAIINQMLSLKRTPSQIAILLSRTWRWRFLPSTINTRLGVIRTASRCNCAMPFNVWFSPVGKGISRARCRTRSSSERGN